MFNITHINRQSNSVNPSHHNGFSLPEVLVAASAGVVLIGASTLALQSTGSLINKMDQKAAYNRTPPAAKS